MPEPRRSLIAYPTQRLLAVVDRREEVPGLIDGLAGVGIDRSDVVVLETPDAIERLAASGTVNRLIARLLRVVQFTTMDQLPDLILYERALRLGRVVIAIRPGTDERKRAAVAVLTDHGAHFINWFGRFSTEEISLWRGPEPDIPGLLRR